MYDKKKKSPANQVLCDAASTAEQKAHWSHDKFVKDYKRLIINMKFFNLKQKKGIKS